MKRLMADLASAILDGGAIDWTSVDSSASEADRSLVDQLKVLAALVGAHRELASPPPPASRDVASTVAAVRAGTPGQWGHLRVLERIGRGAFGEVYRAWDTRLDREVALKLLPAASSNRRRARYEHHRGGASARPRAASERRHDLWRRTDRRPDGPVDGARRGTDPASRSRAEGQALQLGRGGRDRHPALAGDRRRARRGAPAPGHQGPQRDAARKMVASC